MRARRPQPTLCPVPPGARAIDAGAVVGFDVLPQPFVRAEALDAGCCPRRLRRAVSAGRLTRLATGLYAVAPSWRALPPWEKFRLRSEAAARSTPDAIVSHSAAAVLLGLAHPANRLEKVPMTLLDDHRTSPRDAWRQFHRGATPAEHLVIRAQRAYFTPERTVIDCCRELHPRDALAIADGSLRAGLTTPEELAVMRRHQRHWPGVADADVVLRLADARRESWLESVSAWALHSVGHPTGVPQVDVLDPNGRFVARVDALWPEFGLAGEADGRGKHTIGAKTMDEDALLEATRLSLHAERVRENRLRDLGLDVFRWGPADALAVTPLVAKFEAARNRGNPGVVRALYRCTCCRRPLTSCGKGTFSAA